MIQKKICMLGAFAVGKTSLVVQFVKSIFSEKYHTTVGVKIDKKTLRVAEQDVMCILWDLHGEDEFQKVQMSYLRGAAGYLLVIDGTRRESLETAIRLQKNVETTVGRIPFVAVLNKSDLHDLWELDDSQLKALEAQGWNFIRTSAKTGMGVEESFRMLAEKML
ncbi:MAG: GTP-binding protein [Blastocatellia bacterium]|nr:GTP-binding protein [Blastocatellia bacterium]